MIIMKTSENIVDCRHPNPSFCRSNWVNLNGTWEFSFDQPIFDKKITVPFCYESKMSEINQTEMHSSVWYRRTTEIQYNKSGKCLLHFDGVDYRCNVWIDGQYIGSHVGGQTAFVFDISSAIYNKQSIQIVVQAEDDHKNLSMPRGKQYWEDKPKSIFYTHTTGIWKNVWLAFVSDIYLCSVRITPRYDEKSVRFDYQLNLPAAIRLDTEISYQGKIVSTLSIHNKCESGTYSIQLNQTAIAAWNFYEDLTWSPEHPYLFDVRYTLYNEKSEVIDEVFSYFGMRKISVENGRVLLNNRPYYLKMVLDQGYWPDSLMTPGSDEDIIKDITLIQQMGFNGVRIHQKVECARFLYFADKMGLLVWAEFGSAYLYTSSYAAEMYKEWSENILQNYNHPSIIAWVPLNESWGIQEIKENAMEQAHCGAMYHITKSLDQSRIVIDNDGWEHLNSDLLTIHDYEGNQDVLRNRYSSMDNILKFLPGGHYLYVNGKYKGEPILLTEFGGIALNYSNMSEGDWGYSSDQDPKSYYLHLNNVFDAIKASPILAGYCYTQFTDIDSEKNGLLTYDRKPKIPVEKIAALNREK